MTRFVEFTQWSRPYDPSGCTLPDEPSKVFVNPEYVTKLSPDGEHTFIGIHGERFGIKVEGPVETVRYALSDVIRYVAPGGAS